MPKDKKRSDSTRLNLDILPAVKDQIVIVQKRLGAATMTEVIRRALALIDLASEHRAEGGKLIFRHADGTDEILKLI